MKTEINKLKTENRQQMVEVLQKEEKSLELLIAELKTVPDSDELRLTLLEDQLLYSESKVNLIKIISVFR